MFRVSFMIDLKKKKLQKNSKSEKKQAKLKTYMSLELLRNGDEFDRK